MLTSNSVGKRSPNRRPVRWPDACPGAGYSWWLPSAFPRWLWLFSVWCQSHVSQPHVGESDVCQPHVGESDVRQPNVSQSDVCELHVRQSDVAVRRWSSDDSSGSDDSARTDGSAPQPHGFPGWADVPAGRRSSRWHAWLRWISSSDAHWPRLSSSGPVPAEPQPGLRYAWRQLRASFPGRLDWWSRRSVWLPASPRRSVKPLRSVLNVVLWTSMIARIRLVSFITFIQVNTVHLFCLLHSTVKALVAF